VLRSGSCILPLHNHDPHRIDRWQNQLESLFYTVHNSDLLLSRSGDSHPSRGRYELARFIQSG
jgi:hypothetical protein